MLIEPKMFIVHDFMLIEPKMFTVHDFMLIEPKNAKFILGRERVK